MQNELNAISDNSMDFLPLIDKALKSEKIIEILDVHDMEVVYEFDRLFEGTDDEYQSRSVKDGFEFIFDATQRLATVFLYIMPRGAFAAVDAASMDVWEATAAVSPAATVWRLTWKRSSPRLSCQLLSPRSKLMYRALLEVVSLRRRTAWDLVISILLERQRLGNSVVAQGAILSRPLHSIFGVARTHN